MANKRTTQAEALKRCVYALEQYEKSTQGVMIPDASYYGREAVKTARAVLSRIKRETDREAARIAKYDAAQKSI